MGFTAPVDGELYIEIADKRSWDYEANQQRSTLRTLPCGIAGAAGGGGGRSRERAAPRGWKPQFGHQFNGGATAAWYRIEAVAGGFTIDVAGIGGDAPLCGRSVSATALNNEPRPEQRAPEHVLISFTAPADGDYFVLVDGKEYYPYDYSWDYIFGSYEINVSRIVDTPDGAASTAFLKLGVARTDNALTTSAMSTASIWP
ncbi:MAG: PPC domain-containing protein [Gemmataceae bacterium]